MPKAWECTPGPAYLPLSVLPLACLPLASLPPPPAPKQEGMGSWSGVESRGPPCHSMHPTGNGALEGVMHDSWRSDILFTPCDFLCSEGCFT